MLRTLEELRSVIGKNIEDLMDENMTDQTRQIRFDRADRIDKMAKDMINMADEYLRADKMAGRTDRSDDILGK